MDTTQKIQQALQSTTDWQDATCKVIDVFTTEGRPFSSGEVARELRLHRPDLVFSHHKLGNFVKDLYWNESIRYTDSVGNSIYAYQVPRVTTGKGRSQAGTQVFVYSPTIATGEVHDFEVDIPNPQQSSVAPPSSTPLFIPKVVVSSSNPVATVQGDRRMRIPRCVVEEYQHLSNKSIRPREPVFVNVTNNLVSLYFGSYPLGSSSAIVVTHDKGALKFYAPDGAPDFVPGKQYPVKVSNYRIVIDMT